METRNNNDRKVTVHIPVLLNEVITILSLKKGDCVVDGTLGGGGHAERILRELGPSGKYLGIDADEDAIERVKHRLGNDGRVTYVLGNFRDIDTYVMQHELPKVDKVLLDLGLSSDQLDGEAERGFSFQKNEPLRMTFSQHPTNGSPTAWHVVNEWSEASLADVLYGFGEERRSRKIARAIVNAREQKEIETSKELADIVKDAVNGKRRVHPATKTFQAIRMAVNDELGALSEALEKSISILEPKGRIAVITFHSLEDRIVKRAFKGWEKELIGNILTKKPIQPSREECTDNRRARSAKLRCFEKK